ncbi:hypothetical protein E1A91_D01G261500v1 [Gossypium mustelinum]|uniref:non-specific serine/threonine protein kinase n=1 Tax=Gossypium mustelinum TaxID=34275 RepID=A0A5D2WBH4_GOSMU|nr:hypothetical protein E1A91_D01G261500v1 [Gossypium mustelinum]
MELSRKHMEVFNSFFLVYVEVIIFLSCFNLLGLATGSPVVGGNDTDQQALLQFKAKITGYQLEWRGVTCGRKHRRVTKLELQHLKLSGSLSPYVGNISFLRKLSLEGNRFYNKIPQEIGRLRRLQILDLTNNSISGEIPSNLSACSKLIVVYMGSNQLAGEIPALLGHLSQVKFLNFRNNDLRGSIPPSFGNLSSLEELRLEFNGLTGIIPEALGRLTNLSYFMANAQQNAISGIFPMVMFNLSNIIAIDIGANKIQGTLHFDLAVTMPNVEFFSIWGNQIFGQIPIAVWNASSLNILQLNNNRLTGNNKISGRILDRIGNLINLELLDASENQLSGLIPFDIGRHQKLQRFYIDRNFLSGTIPDSIGNLTRLTAVNLAFNNLQGSIPSSLGHCQNLLAMSLSHNNLSGPIPPQAFELPFLSIFLDLKSNYLTGGLPLTVGKLKNLGAFHVSRNRLSGLLPNNLGSCVHLEALILGGNLFEGPIPSSLNSLRGLVLLDVSDNNLSGDVPEFLVSFGALKYLNLSFNDFEGLIPSEGVFKNKSATFVEGNNKLCGGIPELHLSRCNSKTSSDTSLKLKVAIIVVILGVALVFSCLLILWFRKKKELPTTTCAENSILQLSYQSILRATDGFSIQNLLGSGSFGSVYKGILEESGAIIAVKVLNLLNRGASRSFLAECEALRNIRHRNLVKVLTAISGVDYRGNDFKALVYEFIENGSLEEWLHQSINRNESDIVRNLSFFQRVNVAIDVAYALEYLHHQCETTIIHCDLKPSNILLDQEMVGHISDFGLAKILSADRLNYSTNQSSSIGLRGTIGYAPPEYGMGSEISTKGDVYSYGILLLEIFTGKRPTDDMFKEGLSIHNFVEAALPEQVIEITDPILLQERARQGTLKEFTLNDKHLQHLNSIFEIGLTCSAESPTERMDMSDVVSKLCSIRVKLLHPTRVHRERQALYIAQSTGT